MSARGRGPPFVANKSVSTTREVSFFEVTAVAALALFWNGCPAQFFAGRVAADLAIGARADTGAGRSAGAVNVIYGSSRALIATCNQLWTPRTIGLTGKRYLDSFFGNA